MDEIEIDEAGKVYKREQFVLSIEEVRALNRWIYARVGYISYEYDYPVIQLIRRMNRYLEDVWRKSFFGKLLRFIIDVGYFKLKINTVILFWRASL